MAAIDTSALLFYLISESPKIQVDYTPEWGRGTPKSYIDNVNFPQVATDKPYRYRIVKGDKDLGVRDAYEVSSDGSQRINLLEWNSGYGIEDSKTIKVYVVDPDIGNQYLVARWK